MNGRRDVLVITGGGPKPRRSAVSRMAVFLCSRPEMYAKIGTSEDGRDEVKQKRQPRVTMSGKSVEAGRDRGGRKEGNGEKTDGGCGCDMYTQRSGKGLVWRWYGEQQTQMEEGKGAVTACRTLA
jgi:hypothetical protein